MCACKVRRSLPARRLADIAVAWLSLDLRQQEGPFKGDEQGAEKI